MLPLCPVESIRIPCKCIRLLKYPSVLEFDFGQIRVVADGVFDLTCKTDVTKLAQLCEQLGFSDCESMVGFFLAVTPSQEGVDLMYKCIN